MEPKHKRIVGMYRSTSDLNWKDEAIFEDRHSVYFGEHALLIDRNNPELFISPDFDWGSRSRGTKQLALSILLELTNQQEAIRYADRLVEECLVLIHSHRDFSIQIYALQRWLNSKRGQPNQETDLLLWTKIEDPQYHKPIPVASVPVPEKKPMIIEPPVISKSVQRRLAIQKGGSMRGPRPQAEKYPFSKIEVDKYLYFINPTEAEIKKVGGAAHAHGKKYNKELILRRVTAQWAREHNIDVAQDNADVCIIFRKS